jgi:hypothetical protein
MALIFDSVSAEGGRLMREDLERDGREHRVQVGGVLVPWVEADEGLRYLGYWVDLLGDWGNQVARIKKQIEAFTMRVRPARISAEVLLYLLNAVLAPRVIYPLTVAAVDIAEIDQLEGSVLNWALRKLGLHRGFPRKLMYAPVEEGGLGWEPWHVKVFKARQRLARDLVHHPEVDVCQLWASMRLRWYDANQSGRRVLGGVQSADMQRAEGTLSRFGDHKTWVGCFDRMLTKLRIRWDDGWRPLARRVNDVDLYQLANESTNSLTREAIRRGSEQCDVLWVSQLPTLEGSEIPGW